MAFVPIRNLGTVGLVADLKPWLIPPGAWTGGMNVIFTKDEVAKVPGYQTRFAFSGGVWGHGLIQDGLPRLYIARDDGTDGSLHLLNLDQSGFEDVSPTGGLAGGAVWQSTAYGEGIIFNNGADAPVGKQPGDALFAPLPGFPTGRTCRSIRAYKSFLVTVGISDTTLLPTTVAWSNSGDQDEGFPPDWDFANPASEAGQVVLEGTDGVLLDSLTLGDVQILYLSSSCHAMRDVGGAGVMAITRLPFKHGIVAPGAVCDLGQRHFCVGFDRIWMHDGVTHAYPLYEKMERFFYADCVDLQKVRVFHQVANNTVRIVYPSQTAENNDRSIYFNYITGCIGIDEAPDVKCIVQFVPDFSLDTWDTDAQVWDADSSAWDSGLRTGYRITPLLISQLNGKLYEVTPEDYSRDGAPYPCFVEMNGVDIARVIGQTMSDERMLYADTLMPQMGGSAQVYITVGGAKSPGAATLDKPPFVFDMSVPTDLPYRATFIMHARYWKLRFATNDVKPWSLSGFDLNISPSYRR